MKQLISSLARWLWAKVNNGDDIEVMYSQRDHLSTLNTIHVDFIVELERNHPELRMEIAEHQQKRFAAIHYYPAHYHVTDLTKLINWSKDDLEESKTLDFARADDYAKSFPESNLARCYLNLWEIICEPNQEIRKLKNDR